MRKHHEARFGWVRLGMVRLGQVWSCYAAFSRLIQSADRCVSIKWARRGLEWHGGAGHGEVRPLWERKMAKVKNVAEVSNGGADTIEYGLPYTAHVTIQGSSDFLFHRWNCEAVETKAKAAKNSAAKKTDDIESYVWRNDEGELCCPGEYLRQAVIWAAKFKQDPRSPRKSAMDLTKAGVVSLTNLSSFGKTEWDYEDKRRVVSQRAGVNRVRPAMKAGYRLDFDLMVLTPEYIDQFWLQDTLSMAGRLIGIGDFRPTYGRFNIVKFDVSQE